ncbi:hypothetical protein OG233_25390 [Streptomyces sp. NBC_01218]|uniref:hypothetical protein n=1 Tax=unclassified Streptomyces TaxID=2593676 RepID=UPI0023B8F5D2|nr:MULTISPECIES: hypothetical protein [unclassified Streptomyces]WEH42590.1 hypothetical protein PZB77_25550 [Streptomyces sp. AM 2-1-1]WSQ54214.1 hypothetical protein OG233_25390 [Streptomyces sp. NBC_01218]
MHRIGVTGHRSIPPAAYAHVHDGLCEALSATGDSPEALSSLAVGADQLFARLALARGARLTAVIPSDDYEKCFDDEADLARYRELKSLATREFRLDFRHSTDEAYYAAGTWIADHCDRLVAVWDGLPARGLGGTGDIVAYARTLGRPVTVIWRDGVRRD